MTAVTPDNLPFLFAAFAVVWVVFFIYAGYMSWRRRSVQQELDELRESGDGRAVDKAEGNDAI